MLLFVLEEVNPMTKMNLLKPRRKGREYDVRPTMPGKGMSTSCVFTLTYPFYFIKFEKKILVIKKDIVQKLSTSKKNFLLFKEKKDLYHDMTFAIYIYIFNGWLI